MNRPDFLSFIGDFRKNSKVFEDNNLEDFLEAFKRYLDDIDGYYANTNQDIDMKQVDWKIFADLLKCFNL